MSEGQEDAFILFEFDIKVFKVLLILGLSSIVMLGKIVDEILLLHINDCLPLV